MKTIKATPEPISDVFTREFIIPEFQRPYSWDVHDCAQLFSDLADAFRNSSKEQKYFLGSIIYYPDPESDKIWNIVDGQQRLTTLMMLMRALYEKVGVKKYNSLKEMFYKVDREVTRDVIDGAVRLESRVQPEDKRNDLDDLKKALDRDFSGMSKKNPFKLNYERLAQDLENWWQNNESERDNFIKFLRNKVVLLPIECESEDDALTLFEIINNRGMPLDDADIFKAKIYNAVDKNEKAQFVESWGHLKDHLKLFQAYMYILKAKDAKKAKSDKISVKRAELRKYIRTRCLENQDEPLNTGWESIMKSLELCHFYKTNVGEWDSDKVFSAKESIYWTILEEHPTKEYWKYPLFVFIHKYAELGEDGFLMIKPDKKQEYLNLLKNTVKFFFAVGVAKNNIDFVRNPSHKVCIQIEKKGDYLSTFKHEREKVLEELQGKLSDCDYGRHRRGLVFLSSFLNSNQQEGDAVIAYAKVIGGKKVHIEHILPQRWRIKDHYENWNKESHKECLNKIGNLMPLEEKANIRSSDFFFRVKQDEYQASCIEDARDLSNKKKHAHWYPEDLENRDKEAVKRLMEFFRS